jgi:geranylgeranyl diphosphate synthase type II
MDFNQQLYEYIKEVDMYLNEFLPNEQEIPDVIVEAMHYSVSAGGKRLRPILLIEAAKCIGADKNMVLPLASAIEMIHTYSLIHDDLPAMDNDDYRRGKLTNHKVFGEGMAILAGDALLNYSFEIMINNVPKDIDNLRNYVKAIQEIAKAAGIKGMIGGQVKDLECEGKTMDIDTLNYIHTHKTGALIRASLRAGAIAAGATKKELDALTIYGEKLGLAFQIVDDVLDIIGDEKKLGKPVGSDKNNQKITYPAIYGIEKSKEMVDKLLKEALQKIEPFGPKSKFLGELGIFICKRDH